jgi:hypothetical protein
VLRSVGSGGLGSLDLEIDGALSDLNSVTGLWGLIPIRSGEISEPNQFFFARF